jgi:long-subunit acyl-CoA synthetase (AMP-forming)
MQKDKISKVWKGMNYKVYREKVVNMAKVFIKLGLERHGTVAILGDNCIEWFIADLRFLQGNPQIETIPSFFQPIY